MQWSEHTGRTALKSQKATGREDIPEGLPEAAGENVRGWVFPEQRKASGLQSLASVFIQETGLCRDQGRLAGAARQIPTDRLEYQREQNSCWAVGQKGLSSHVMMMMMIKIGAKAKATDL